MSEPSRAFQESIDKRNAAVMELEANYRAALKRIDELERSLSDLRAKGNERNTPEEVVWLIERGQAQGHMRLGIPK